MHQRFAAQPERRAQRDRKHFVEHLVGGLIDRSEVERAGVVDDDIEPPERRDRGRDDRGGGIVGGDVGGMVGKAHGRAELLTQRLQLGFGAPDAQHRDAVRAEPAHDRLADAAGRAGDDRCLLGWPGSAHVILLKL